jgi:hypothetical protein
MPRRRKNFADLVDMLKDYWQGLRKVGFGQGRQKSRGAEMGMMKKKAEEIGLNMQTAPELWDVGLSHLLLNLMNEGKKKGEPTYNTKANKADVRAAQAAGHDLKLGSDIHKSPINCTIEQLTWMIEGVNTRLASSQWEQAYLDGIYELRTGQPYLNLQNIPADVRAAARAQAEEDFRNAV